MYEMAFRLPLDRTLLLLLFLLLLHLLVSIRVLFPVLCPRHRSLGLEK